MNIDGLVVFICCTFVLLSLFCLDEYRDFQNSQNLNEKIETIRAEARKTEQALRAEIDSLDRISSENVWLARSLYYETKRPQEMRQVAWVVRNRVDSGFRGDSTYKETILHNRQFSPFNRLTRHHLIGPFWKNKKWQTALNIAQQVRRAPGTARPFTARFFYSPISMTGHPHWRWAGTVIQDDPRITIVKLDS